MLVFVYRYFRYHLRPLLQSVFDVFVLVRSRNYYITLPSQVGVGSLHYEIRFFSLTLNIYQFVLHVVQILGSVNELIAHSLIEPLLGIGLLLGSQDALILLDVGPVLLLLELLLAGLEALTELS